MRSKMPDKHKRPSSQMPVLAFVRTCVFTDSPRVVGGRGGLQGWEWRPAARPDCHSAGRRTRVMMLLLLDMAGVMLSEQRAVRPISVVTSF